METSATRAARLCEDFARQVNEVLVSKSVVATGGKHAAYLLLDASLGHFRAIAYLVGAGLYGSAFALWRPQYEALVRGTWLARCASEAEIGRFLRKRSYDFKHVVEMLSDMQERSVEIFSELQWLKDRHYKLMNDFTHGGRLQASVRYGPDEIGERIPDDHAVELLRMAAIMSALGADVILGIGDEGSGDRSSAIGRLLDGLMSELRPDP